MGLRRAVKGMLTKVGLSGFSGLDLLDIVVTGRGYVADTDLPYGDGPRRRLDVYRPANARAGAPLAAPVIVFFYGGNWESGARRHYRFVGHSFAGQGFVTVVPDYRLYPEVRYPGFIEDGASAVRWVKDNATRFGGDPNKLFLMGHSAGAYIAAMLALDGRWLGEVGLTPGRDIAGLIGISGPYDILPLHDGTLKEIFGGNDPATQPISHVSAGAPPSLLLTGRRDDIVDPGNTARLAARLEAAGDAVTVRTYSWVGHLAIIGAFAPALRLLAPVADHVAGFVARVSEARS